MAKITSVKTSVDNNKLFTAQINDDNTREFKEYNIGSGINNKTLQETADVTSFNEGMDVITVNPSGDKFIGVDRRGREVVNLGTGNNFSVNSFNLLNTYFVNFKKIPIQYVIVGGGGSGGGAWISNTTQYPGGGGAGGYLTSLKDIRPGQVYNIIIGNGGVSVPNYTVGLNGENSVFDDIIAYGGGGGAGGAAKAKHARNGGSGGGSGYQGGGLRWPGGKGVEGQGHDGGSFGPRGGGGAGGTNNGGYGGPGLINPITNIMLARGGDYIAGSRTIPGTNGTPNTGSGGSGGFYLSGAGGSGIVILRYPSNLSITPTSGNLVLNTYTAPDDPNFKVTEFTSGTGNISFN